MITQNSRSLTKLLFLVIGTTAALTAQLLIASPAKAECVYDGEIYQTDDEVGPYICTADGSMQPK